MAIKGRDREFRVKKLSYVDFKPVNMDRVLTMLFPRLRFDGYGTRRPPRKHDLTVGDFAREYTRDARMFAGFGEHLEIVERWIETDLMDLVNRGRPNQALAAPRPLHGNTYKFRNARHARDYGAAEQLYWMLYAARGGRGQAARDALRRFFFAGVGPTYRPVRPVRSRRCRNPGATAFRPAGDGGHEGLAGTGALSAALRRGGRSTGPTTCCGCWPMSVACRVPFWSST